MMEINTMSRRNVVLVDGFEIPGRSEILLISSGGLKGAFSACAQIYVTFGIGKDNNSKRGIGMGYCGVYYQSANLG